MWITFENTVSLWITWWLSTNYPQGYPQWGLGRFLGSQNSLRQSASQHSTLLKEELLLGAVVAGFLRWDADRSLAADFCLVFSELSTETGHFLSSSAQPLFLTE